jgi:hypothetical protein
LGENTIGTPPVLAERGLGDAIRALALDCPVVTTAEIDLPGRVAAPVAAAAAYFAAAEALTNVAKPRSVRYLGHIPARCSRSSGIQRIVRPGGSQRGSQAAVVWSSYRHLDE